MRHLIILISFLFILPVSMAQPPDPSHDMSKEKREMIKQRKIAFITHELDFSTEEAEKFWPVYNEMEKKNEKLIRRKRKIFHELKNIDDLSEKDAYSKMEELFAIEKEENELRIEYLAKFADILGKKKAAKVYIAEEKFKRELVRMMHKKGRHNGHDKGRRP